MLFEPGLTVANTPSVTVPPRGNEVSNTDKYIVEGWRGNYQLVTKGDKKEPRESKRRLQVSNTLDTSSRWMYSLLKWQAGKSMPHPLKTISTGVTADGDFKPFNAGSEPAPKGIQ